MEGKEIKEKENNWKENFLKKTQNITGNISDDIVINKITQDNNNGRNNKREAFEVELETTNNTSVFITINDISNYSNFPNDNIIHDYQLEILNKKHEIIIILILLKNSISNYTIFIVDRIKTKFGSKFQLINILAKIAFLINLEKENEENFSKIINILLILFMGNIKDLLLGPFSNLNYEEKEVAKKEIELICKIENNNKKMKCKVLNYLFHEKLEELFKKYLNDSFYIIIGKSNFCLKKIQTFKDNFNEYETEKKQNIKKCVYFSLGYELTNYEKSSIEENNIVQQIKINHYNSRRVIINEAIISFFSIIKKYSLDKYGIKIYKPTLKNKLKHNVKQYEKFFNNKLKFIFSYLMPRRNKKGKNYSNQIDEVLKKEKEEEEVEENRNLAILLDLVDIKSFVRAFINDEKIIKIKDNNGKEFNLYLPNLKTFKDCVGYLPKEIADDIKKDFINLLDGKIIPRKSSELRNSRLKNNKNLTGRKRKRSN